VTSPLALARADATPARAPENRSAEAARAAPEPLLLVSDAVERLEVEARALGQARVPERPALERLRLLSSVSAHLDELFVVRVAALKRRASQGPAEAALAADQLARIAARTRSLLDALHATWRDAILPALADGGIRIVAPADLSGAQREASRRSFAASVFPALTPLAVDPGHPFPHLRHGALAMAVSLQRREGRRRRGAARPLALVEIPAALPRLVRVPSGAGDACVLLEDLVVANVADLLPGNGVRATAVFRVTRSADPEPGPERPRAPVSPLRARPLRREGAAVRLEISADAHAEIVAPLARVLGLEPRDVHPARPPLDLAGLLAACERLGERA
jgi:polyphosphate kinase